MSTTSVIIGRQADDRSVPIHLEASARARSTYVIGIQGTGKSTLLESTARWDMANGDGLIFLDPHSTSVLQLLEQVPGRSIEDVIYWNPADRDFPFGLNPFHCPDPNDYDRRADNFIAALSSVGDYAAVFAGAARMKDLLHHLALAFVIKHGSTLSDAARFLTDGEFRRGYFPALNRAGYGHIREYWEEFGYLPEPERERRSESSLNKLRPFQRDLLMRRIFSQPTPSINMRWAMDTGKIVLVNLNREALGEENASLIGAFIIHDLLTAALSRVSVPADSRRPFHIIADEFQLYMSTAFSMLISEGRKFGVDVMVAHQYRAQLGDSRTRGATTAVGNLVVFQVNGEDARELSTSFDIVIPPATVTNVRPIQSFTPNAMRHIQEHGHVDPGVVERHQDITKHVEKLLQWAKDCELDPACNNAPILESVRVHYHRLIDAAMYDAMTRTAPWDWDGEFELDLVDPLLTGTLLRLAPAVDELYREIDVYRKTLPSNFLEEATFRQRAASVRPEWTTWGSADWANYFREMKDFERARQVLYEQLGRSHEDAARYVAWKDEYADEHLVRRLPTKGRAVAKRNPNHPRELLDPHPFYDMFLLEWEVAIRTALLGRLLRVVPAYVSTGQMEPAQEQVRTHADVQAEIANVLANLPRYHARCKLATSAGTTESMVSTIPFDPNDPMSVPTELPPEGIGSNREAIIEHSQRTYGHFVQDASPGILNQQDDRHDDDGPIFGEKASAPKA